MELGLRVVRGPDWLWSEQDGGEGAVGTVVHVGSETCTESPDGTVVVYWDTGFRSNYRVGYNNAYDLRIYDNATIGVQHVDIICNECKKQGIAGLRFKCTVCNNYDLCQLCYMADRHDLEHRFQRFDDQYSPGVDLPPRKGCVKMVLKGTFVGAKVMRGKDWEWGEQDGIPGKFGRVLEVSGWNNETWRSVVKVIWWTGFTNIYRLGYKGKVDLVCVEPASPGTYYPAHLPVLGGPPSAYGSLPTLTDFAYYERVKIVVDSNTLKLMQKGHNGWNVQMADTIGLVGRVHRVTEKGDVRVWYPQLQVKWTLNPRALIKVNEHFDKGDNVIILKDKAVVSKLQRNGHGDWIEKMDSILGKTGKVVKVYEDGDLRVTVDGQTWTLNPLCVESTGERVASTSEGSDLAEELENLDLATSMRMHRIIYDAGQGLLGNVEEYFTQNPDKINFKSDNRTCLQVAAHQGQMAVVKKLLEMGADLNIKDDVGDTALHYAAFGSHSGIMDVLLGAGADINAVNHSMCTALHICISKKLISCIKVLLKYKPDVNIQDKLGDTPLHDAIANECSEAIELLTEYPGVNFDLRNHRGFNILHQAAIKGNSFAVECILLVARDLVDLKKDDGFTALHLAALNGYKNVTEVLVMSGKAEVDLVNNKHQTPLMLSVSQGHCGTTELLIHCGASLSAVDEDGDSALHMVLIKSAYITTQVKKDKVPRIDQSTCPDIFRIYSGLEYGEENKDRLIALSIACYLVEEGSSLSVTNNKGKTPIDLVSRPGDADILKTFLITDAERSRRREAKGPVECLVCSELCTSRVLLEPCGHKVACEDCTTRLKKCFKCHIFITKRIAQDGRVVEYKAKQPSVECLRYLETKIAEIEEVHCCTICMERRKNVVFLCGHSACDKCSAELITCHMCRRAIVKKINVY